MSFHGQLYFANVSYFEDTVNHIFEENPQAERVLVDGSGINEIDASGEAMLRELVAGLRERGKDLSFIGLKPQIIEVMKRSGFIHYMTEDNFFDSLAEARERYGITADEGK